MTRVSLNIKVQISKVIKKFKFEELEFAVFPIFPELLWVRVKSKLVKQHQNLTTSNALKIMEKEIEKANLSREELNYRLNSLEVIDVSRHYRKKVWYGYEFKSRDTPDLLTIREIEEKIKESFTANQMEVDAIATQHNGIVFVSIKEKPDKRRKKLSLPTYFSFILNENFFFCSKKTVIKSTLIAVTEGMGYRQFKQIKLTGKDIPSLVQMLLLRKIAAVQGNTVKISSPLKLAPPVATTLGLDFTQHKHRKEYAEKYLGSTKVTFETLKLKCLNQNWKSKDAQEKLPDEEIYVGVEFRSLIIPNFLKNLVTQKILAAPLPVYAANILSLGRNDLILKESLP